MRLSICMLMQERTNKRHRRQKTCPHPMSLRHIIMQVCVKPCKPANAARLCVIMSISPAMKGTAQIIILLASAMVIAEVSYHGCRSRVASSACAVLSACS